MSITSANATLTLTIPGIYSAPQQIQGFGVDDAWMVRAVAATETKVGVDGFGTAGFIPRAPVMTIKLLADSPSFVVFENWIFYQDQIVDVTYGAMVMLFPSVRRKYIGYKGALMDVSSFADAKKVMEDREFAIQWLPQGPGVPAITGAPM